MAGPFGCGGGGGGATPVPTMGSLEIGFVDSPAGAYQAISLNIVSVRLNPATVVSTPVPDIDPNWVTVTAPPASGSGELSINLLDFQNDAVVFNTGQIPAQTYHQIQVVIDTGVPGFVIPSCTTGAQEGCITANVSLGGTSSLTTQSTVTVSPGGLQPLIIDISPGSIVPPSAPGGNYTLNPTISVAPSGAFLGTVNGTVTGLASTSSDTINAEVTGTNSVVASAPVSSSDGFYQIQLPAGVNGTAYDLFVSGSTAFAVKTPVTVTRGGSVTGQDFNVASPATGTIMGSVIDGRTGGALVGATVNLLLQQSTADNCATSMAGCVVVATTTTNSAGNYTFSSVPAPVSSLNYYMQASMTGTQTVTQLVSFSSSGVTCPAGPNPSNCSFNLPNELLTGTVMVDPPPAAGTNIVVTVMAEQTGTGNLVGLTQVTVPSSGTFPFALEVPPAPPGTNVDLIASAQDAYLGVGTPYSGHSLAVMSDINPASPGSITLTVGCLGHGTIAGVANSSDAGTHVRLFQSPSSGSPNLVQLMDSTVGSTVAAPTSGATPAYPNQYSFCAPPNTYTIQRFEETSATASPVGTPTMIVVPPPSPVATSSPCPLCENAAKACPGNCSATMASPLATASPVVP